MTTRWSSLVALALLVTVSATGCVSQRQYDDLKTSFRRSQEQVVELQARIAELEQRIKLLSGSSEEKAAAIAKLLQERDDALTKLGAMEKELEALRSAYGDIATRQPHVVLKPELDAALRAFAEKFPDLVTYDPYLGMVKFRSDLTFPSGSAQLSDKARSTLTKLAEILKSPAATEYDIRIVGHTDNVRISRPETLRSHPTNWYLSAHRAIAVRDALDKDGVQADRTSVTGYSQYWPVVANARGGAEANRRVEIYMVTARPKGMLRESAAPAPAAPVAPAEPVAPAPVLK